MCSAKLYKEDLENFSFMTARNNVTIGGISGCRITRCGYTGEDGFEISVPTKDVVSLAEQLTNASEVKLAGLGPRDSLRLECGLCLYGNDIDETTTPIEAGLTWVIGKRRRLEGGFLGDDVILGQLKNGVTRKRVAVVLPNGIARAHTPIEVNGQKIGELTSGAWGPSVEKGIGMGYVKVEFEKPGTEVELPVRRKRFAGSIVQMPIVPTSFYRKKK
eukprot:TRINITY_DN7067_c0_g1_i2.p2 TRINITY_DN7067_c0_g1~~TRINITY_DN7067_c0_g1_i2.p2  ORF type:complete len:217 (-),score=56.26 TRINITY_DN7067_c0_g1_i2:19-669(-)